MACGNPAVKFRQSAADQWTRPLKRETIRWALDWLRIDPKDRAPSPAAPVARERQTRPSAEADNEAKRAAAWRLWLAGTPLVPGDLAYRYLSETRGIDLAALDRMPGALRFCRH